MATTSSRQTALFGIQDWVKKYQPYAAADLQSFSYETLRANFVEYLKREFPETFDDFVESSEFVAILDLMAYMGQGLGFRSDLNARENFLSTAERRDSVIKLANLVGYNPKRNTSAQGLVKITAISTTESVTDINGVNLSNTTILWNDPANSSWQEQFNTILNAALVNSQRIGRPGNSQTILDTKTDEYAINIPTGKLPVVPYRTEVDGSVMNFELVSATSLNSTSLYEIPPAPTSQFNILYRNDKLGYGSANTGFFCYFKQGTLQSQELEFREKIVNNIQRIDIQGINDSDTWLYQLNDAGQISTQWTKVESVHSGTNKAQANEQRLVFSVSSRANDEVSYVFSDGVFGEVPYGLFRAYFRASNALRYQVSPGEMSGINVNMEYVSRVGTTESLSFTFSLQTPSNTAASRETLSAIKERAPARFYTQNRMVNGEDYTNFPFTRYNSIIKSKAVNRSSIGISRNLELLDPTGKYSSTNVFATDGAIYYNDGDSTSSFSTFSTVYATEFLSSSLPVLLSSVRSVQYYQQYYPRYDGSAPVIGNFFWHQSTVVGSSVTGYFFTIQNDKEVPAPVGSFSTYSTRYISAGTQLKFVAPAGKKFDVNNRLIDVTSQAPGVPEIWVGVTGVIGDGYNYGNGNLSNGVGPITLSAFVPGSVLDSSDTIVTQGAKLADVGAIIPQFDNTLSNTIVKQALSLINQNEDFWLVYNNSINSSQERWSVVSVEPSDHFIRFTHDAIGQQYLVSIRGVTYRFSSVADVRFLFSDQSRVYDPKSGQVLRDTIKIDKNNGLSSDVRIGVTGQTAEIDGFVNDFEVEVSSLDVNTGFSLNPDFFEDIVGGLQSTNQQNSVFFSITSNSGIDSRITLSPGVVEFSSTLQSANEIKYQFADRKIFYCPTALTLTSVSRPPGSNVVTVQTSTDHALQDGTRVTIGGFDSNNYNGDYVVTTVGLDPNKFSYTISSNTATLPTNNGQMYNRFYESRQEPGTVPPVFKLYDVTSDYQVECGRNGLSFQYKRNSGNTTRIDPATTNIIDLYLVTQSYYTSYMNWLADTTGKVAKPSRPTINEMKQEYGGLDEYKMISDSVIPNSVVFKPLFGNKADPALRGTIKVVKNPSTTASDSQIRSSILSALNTYFAIDKWSFGDTLFFSELTAYLHMRLGSLISSVILVPTDPTQRFGALYEVRSAPNEIFCNGADVSSITVVSALTSSIMNR